MNTVCENSISNLFVAISSENYYFSYSSLRMKYSNQKCSPTLVLQRDEKMLSTIQERNRIQEWEINKSGLNNGKKVNETKKLLGKNNIWCGLLLLSLPFLTSYEKSSSVMCTHVIRLGVMCNVRCKKWRANFALK